ncbi:MAG TPA: serine hydrolase domain-containing protein [Symbiobacteriaceae bacterium]|jgi:CubicO group peptidase (beta-lactamase class C family)|nr:serine hydrolase domain-containing protein [Symbiobacteriaceae bacterium]
MTVLLPTTPAAERLQRFLEHFNTGLPASFRTMLADYFREEPTDRAIAWYSLMFQDTRGLDVVRAEQSEEHRVAALVRLRGFDGWGTLTVAVEPEPPHRIATVWFSLQPAPVDLRGTGTLSDGELATRLEEHVRQLEQVDLFSGSVLVARGGQPVFEHACGLASKAYGAPNRVDTKFNLGSMNKMVTGVAVAQLVQAGKLALTDTVAKFLPDWPEPVASTVTVHHLLTHTSGMTSYWNQQFEERKGRLRSVSDFLPLFRNDPLAFEPGARFQYSNSGFMLLGAIIEQVTGQSYYDYVREQIYAPAGMTETECYDVDETVPNLATGYTRRTAAGTFQTERWLSNIFLHVAKGGPAGGGFSTAPDMLRFATALQEHRLLDPAHTDLVLTGKVDCGPGMQYGYGFFDDRSSGARVVGHSGGFSGINSVLDIYPDLGYNVIVMSNYDPPAAQRVSMKIHELLARA